MDHPSYGRLSTLAKLVHNANPDKIVFLKNHCIVDV